jgi:hypothetical protein
MIGVFVGALTTHHLGVHAAWVGASLSIAFGVIWWRWGSATMSTATTSAAPASDRAGSS